VFKIFDADLTTSPYNLPFNWKSSIVSR